MRRILFAAAGLLSLACSGVSIEQSWEQSSAEPGVAECGWEIVSLVSWDVPCWQIESLDVSLARLRADGREHDCWGEIGECDLFACERVGSLNAMSVVQVLAPTGVPSDEATAATVLRACN